MNQRGYAYETDCVSSTYEAIRAMVDQARGITRRTFLRYVDRDELHELEGALGYARHPSQGLTCAADWHVRYGRSKYRGRRCVFLVNSAIEYIFTEGD